MKNSFRVLCLLACAFFATSTMKAQTYNVVYGRTTIAVDPNLLASFRQYLTLTDLQGHALSTPLILKVNSGTIAVNNGAGELFHDGGLLATTGNTVVQIQNLILDISNPSNPVVTAVVIANGNTLGRIPLFNVSASTGAALSVQNSAVSQNGFGFRLTSNIVNLVNQLTGVPLVAENEYFGTVNLYTVLSSSPAAIN